MTEQINGFRFDLWLPSEEHGHSDHQEELIELLQGSGWIPEIPGGYADEWWFCQGILPSLKFLVVGIKVWAKARNAIFRVLTPESPTFPPETGIGQGEDIEGWFEVAD